MRILEGHEELVRCIRFDSKRIVSGAYDGKIKVWDLIAAMDPRSPTSDLCLRTLVVSEIYFSLVYKMRFNMSFYSFLMLLEIDLLHNKIFRNYFHFDFASLLTYFIDPISKFFDRC